jgi:D-beta-D-heptose 7-phosphate kinase/D-beta-D-heptose 1-phosphate adenosyltransferase
MVDFSNLKVLVIGDACLDIIEDGTSTRLAPECPVPVILNPTESYTAGMASNVALNLKGLGADVYISGIVGVDKYGNILQDILEENGIKPAFKHTKSVDIKCSTIVKKRVFANGHQIARIDYEELLNENDIVNIYRDILMHDLDDMRGFFDLVIVSDYNKGLITEKTWFYIWDIINYVSKKDDNVFVDTKKLNVTEFFDGMHIFPNTKEIESMMEYNKCSSRGELRRKMNLPFLIETASENGAFLYGDGNKLQFPIYKTKNVVDVYGCGDTFVAAFSLFYTKFRNEKQALKFANYCFSKVVQKKGTTPITLREVTPIILSEGMEC